MTVPPGLPPAHISATSESCTFTGDHTAIEDWAAALVEQHVGRAPSMAVFSGDYQGVHIDPKRLETLGIVSRYAEPVLIRPGEAVEWTGAEFTAQGRAS